MNRPPRANRISLGEHLVQDLPGNESLCLRLAARDTLGMSSEWIARASLRRDSRHVLTSKQFNSCPGALASLQNRDNVRDATVSPGGLRDRAQAGLSSELLQANPRLT